MKHHRLATVIALASMTLSTSATAGTVTTDGADIKINTKGGLSVGTVDGNYSIKAGGRIMYDYNRAELDGEPDNTEDQFGIRRARLYLAGTINEFSYKAQFNILGGGSGGSPEDVYIRYNGWGKEKVVTVGRQRLPFGLEAQTSSNDITFLERSAITESADIGRADGVQLSGQRGDFTYAVAAFEDERFDGGDDFAAAARVTFAPINSDGNLLHLGLAHQDGGDDFSATGLEVAGTAGPLHAQVEWVDSDKDGESMEGYYVQVGYIFTGETRPYKGGKFKRVKPSGDNGAFEVVFRFEDGDGNHGDIEIGQDNVNDIDDAESYGIGLNWYPNSNVRFGVTYTEGESNTSDEEGKEFRARAQLTF